MTCPSSAVLDQLYVASTSPGGQPLPADLQACYNQYSNSPTAYKNQYDGSSAFMAVAQNNPQSMLNPAPGTTPVPANTSLIGSIFNLLGTGANSYQQYQLAQAKAHVLGTGAQMYVDPNLLQQAQQKSTPTWEYAAGAGVALLALVALVVIMARRD